MNKLTGVVLAMQKKINEKIRCVNCVGACAYWFSSSSPFTYPERILNKDWIFLELRYYFISNVMIKLAIIYVQKLYNRAYVEFIYCI